MQTHSGPLRGQERSQLAQFSRADPRAADFRGFLDAPSAQIAWRSGCQVWPSPKNVRMGWAGPLALPSPPVVAFHAGSESFLHSSAPGTLGKQNPKSLSHHLAWSRLLLDHSLSHSLTHSLFTQSFNRYSLSANSAKELPEQWVRHQ